MTVACLSVWFGILVFWSNVNASWHHQCGWWWEQTSIHLLIRAPRVAFTCFFDPDSVILILTKKPHCTEIWRRMNKCMHFVIYLQKRIYVQSLHVECFSRSNPEELRGNILFSNNKLFLHMFLSIQINGITREMSHFNWVCSLCLSLSCGKHQMH